MTRQEVLDNYNVVNGVILSPGKFEGEGIYTPEFWDLTGHGADEELVWLAAESTTYIMNVDAAMRAEWPEIPQEAVVLALEESDQGFVSCAALTQAEYDKLVDTNETENEEFDGDNDENDNY